MIHWIAGKKRGVAAERAEEDDGKRLERCSSLRHLPLRDEREGGDSKAG